MTSRWRTLIKEIINPEGAHWRWRVVQIWILVFTVVIIVLIRNDRNNIHELQHTKAGVVALEKTNCALRQFLQTAAVAREQLASKETGTVRENDMAAARSYHKLAGLFFCG